ncbi:type II secretion system F family protein [Crossiella sp. SN42]|uniref:type II secretion system F family protein n=1 Tax=Crossiella sp. SN42 TaxID=2944808 RepID=UPI00207CC51C|nr:type II secretion system F family protein [Crossiella sp. SN42]MCO1575878.1 type II secretion system F family protein [Crossiella sp. SN42]
MTLLVTAGAGVGLGLWMLVVGLFPPRPPLSRVLEELTTVPDTPRTDTRGGLGAAVVRAARRGLPALGWPTLRTRRYLEVIGTSVEVHVVTTALMALTGLLAPVLVYAALAAVGLELEWEIPAVTGLVLAAGAVALAEHNVHHTASLRRDSFRHALAAYLNLLRILLAGGAGIDSALTDAVDIGQGWPFHRIRHALDTARLTRTTPWRALGKLGAELDIDELVELGAVLTLAGAEGARVRASLTAKAAAVHTRELADAEGRALAATERMTLPVVLLFAAFLALIGYPALAQILGGL